MSDAEIHIEHGNKYPYDAPDSWWQKSDGNPPPPADKAHAAARGIISDLKDRRDIKHQFDNVDEEVRSELVETHAAIIRTAMDMPEPPAAKVKTLRDEFAMAALTSLMWGVPADDGYIAECCYRIADSMMKAREG
jgi:hypothetical protein